MNEAEVAHVVLSAIANAAVKKVISKLGRKARESIDPAIVQGRLELQARQIGSVKTLLSTDSPVAIEKFYCAPRVKLGTQLFVPLSSEQFRYDQVLIEGIAGQGKSILLRALCANAIIEKGKIAFFYELRRLDDKKPLVSIILDSLRELGIPGNTETLRTLALERGMEIYLDGFDEIDQKKAERIDREIAYLITNHQFLRIFISSRPHTDLSKNSSFSTHRIESLNHQDVNRLIDKLSQDQSLAKSLKQKLIEHRGKVLDLLETPLLVTLLIAQYSQTQQIPEQLSEFYESIFPVLFERHDSFKSPFQRRKRLSITTLTYRKIFQKFCFVSLFVSALSENAAIKLVNWAVESLAPGVGAEDFLNDVSDISSLINEEGNIWSFIHSSVQEYYAASFILSGSDEELSDYAERFQDIPNETSRNQVFRFAREIDEFRFIKYVQKPFYEKLLNPLGGNCGLEEDDCCVWVGAHAKSIAIDKNLIDGGWFFTVWIAAPSEIPFRFFVSSILSDSVSEILSSSDALGAKLDKLWCIATFRRRMINLSRPLLDEYVRTLNYCNSFIVERERENRNTNRFLISLLDKSK